MKKPSRGCERWASKHTYATRGWDGGIVCARGAISLLAIQSISISSQAAAQYLSIYGTELRSKGLNLIFGMVQMRASLFCRLGEIG